MSGLSSKGLEGAYVGELKLAGCVRVRVAQPRAVSTEKKRIARAARRLGSKVISTYHHPWLYVVLTDKLPDEVVVGGEAFVPSTVERPSDVGTESSHDAPGSLGFIRPCRQAV